MHQIWTVEPKIAGGVGYLWLVTFMIVTETQIGIYVVTLNMWYTMFFLMIYTNDARIWNLKIAKYDPSHAASYISIPDWDTSSEYNNKKTACH